ncbi:uncharacterized protein LOC105848255 isoform X2 [Hydra vulgaris]|nr:uncharacterized protein LOC105848255 isoform X2 [Hydra vulgaris]XP_047141749.1 uncharacterized protein LOC105848255 isoform X2 [Hydra vulgaris]
MFLGQLVGMLSFTQSLAQSVPSSLKLENMKFTIMQKSHYLLFLGFRDLDQPESYLKKKLQMFVDIFTFYNGSFDRLRQSCQSKEDFLSKLDLLCTSYIQFTQCFFNTVTSIFYSIPRITFNKVTSIIFLKAARLLEACQKENGIECGCVLSEGRMIYSQIPYELTHHLLLLYQQKCHSPRVFYPGIELPFGVSIRCIYVTIEQYNRIVSSSLMNSYKNNNEGTESFSNTSADHYSCDTVENSVVNFSSDIANCHESKISKDEPSNLIQDDTIALHLYVQNYSNTIILLFMNAQVIYGKKEITKLWELSLPCLKDIEAQLKSLVSPQKLQNARDKYESHLSYQKIGLCKNNLKKMDNEEELINTINTIHQQFKSSPGTTDIFLRNHRFTVFGKQTETEEVFYQPNIKQRSTGELQIGADMTWLFDLYSNDRQSLKKSSKN